MIAGYNGDLRTDKIAYGDCLGNETNPTKQDERHRSNLRGSLPLDLQLPCAFDSFVSIGIRAEMYLIEKTTEFDKWLRNLRDLRARARILVRLQKLENDEHFGDCKHVGQGIRELRINYAKGYRVYFKEEGGKLIILLTGGDKSTQQQDIQKAKEIWNKLRK